MKRKVIPGQAGQCKPQPEWKGYTTLTHGSNTFD